MRRVFRWMIVLAMGRGGWAAPPRLAQAANQDTTADRVFGQQDFTHTNIGVSATSLVTPEGAALDPQGDLYVADSHNNRVLEYNAPLSSGMAASRVFGQPSMITNTENTGGLSATSLSHPFGVAVDGQGNLYVADTVNERVLEYAAPLSSGMAASLVFGQGGSFTSGNANQGGVSADSLSDPLGLVVDPAGNVYVADAGNNRVLEYGQPLAYGTTADHVFGQPSFITNTAHTGSVGPNTLDSPNGVALDAPGNLYVADTLNNRVLEYDAPLNHDTTADRVFGQLTLFTSNQNNGGVAAGLHGPTGLAVDAQGNLCVADFANNRVLEYDTPLTADTSPDRVFGQPDLNSNGSHPLSDTSLSAPLGVAVDAAGNVYVADYNNSRVLEYDVPVPYGVPAVTALSPDHVAAGSPAFTLTVNGAGFVPGSQVSWNGSARPTTYLNSTQLNAAISAADLTGGSQFPVTVFTPGPGGGTSSLLNLSLYSRASQDTTADAVQGQPNFTANSINNPLMAGAHRLSSPQSVAVDARSGRLFVVDDGNNRVLSWANAPALANGQPADLVLGQPNLTAVTPNTGGLSARSLNGPFGAAVDAQGDLYVADFGNNRVLEYDAPLSTGMAANRVFGQGGNFNSGLANNGGISANSLWGPAGLALDAPGNLWVTDYNNARVLEYDTPLSAGTIADRVLGQPSLITNTVNNGGLSAASLYGPAGLALDPAGNLYVADYNDNRVLEYDAPLSSGQAGSRVFGQPTMITNTVNNGGVSALSLAGPVGLALDAAGDLWVADSGNNRVLEYNAPLTAGADRRADRVLGQGGSFTTTVSAPTTANSLSKPYGVALDAHGDLYVTDLNDNRVLEYDRPWPLLDIFLPLVRR